MAGYKTLDVGCGEIPNGDVNIDIYDIKNKKNHFIIASAEYLPFKKNTFNTVRSSYVIEHCVKVEQFIKDHLRVARKKVIIITDNNEWVVDRLFRLTGKGRLFNKEHVYSWNKEYMENLLKKIGIKKFKVELKNLSPTLLTRILSKLAITQKLKHFFLRDLYIEINQ